jgi:diamine N-acetyltransferase
MNSEKPVITTANINDTAILADLSVITFWESVGAYNKQEDMQKYTKEQMNAEKIMSEINDASCLFFLAHYDNCVAGYAKVSTRKIPIALKDNNPIEIERIYVLRKYHNKKIGAALMQHCLDHATSKMRDPVWLGVWERNERAIDFYKKWGFELFGSHIFRLGDDDQNDLLMKKQLQLK